MLSIRSRLPTPVAVSVTLSDKPVALEATVTGGRGKQVAGPTAAAAFSRPNAQRVAVPAIGSARDVSRSTTAWLDVPNAVDQTSAATPAACGVAGEVPVTGEYVPMKSVERMLTPAQPDHTGTEVRERRAGIILIERRDRQDMIAVPGDSAPASPTLSCRRCRPPRRSPNPRPCVVHGLLEAYWAGAGRPGSC